MDGTGADVFLSYVTTSVGSPMGVAAWHGTVFRPNSTETPRKLRFAGDVVVVGRGCTGDDDTHAPGFSWCVVRLRTADRFSWREDGKGREERAHALGPRDDSQLTSWTDRADATERALGAKAHEGGAVLSHLFCGGGLLWLLLSGGRRESVCPPIVRVS